MKKFRKLIPALCMLLVSALFVGTSTYAWFSMNKEVTATNMSVTATADNPYLQIKLVSEAETAYATTKAADPASAENLKLTVPLNLKNNHVTYLTAEGEEATNVVDATTAASVTWGYATSNDPAASKNTDGALKPTIITDASTGYYLKDEFNVRVVPNSAEGKNLKVKLTGTGTLSSITKGNNDIWETLRILVIAEDGKYVVLKANATGNALEIDKSSNDGVLVDSLPQVGTASKLTVYTYFDGTHEKAYTNHAKDLTTINTSLVFTVD